MIQEERYASPSAVEAAIGGAARKAFTADPTLQVQERIRLEYFHRFLSRVFSEGAESGWVLKGGTGMLARVASARSTTDVDLFRRDRSLDGALEDLRYLVAQDLGDFFRFEYSRHSDAVDGNQQMYVDGLRVDFDVYIGIKKKDTLRVDLVVDVAMIGDVEVMAPANALDLPKLTSNPYRLYSVVDQVADKVCATHSLYNGRASSREKDLVDLVVLATSHDVDAGTLRRALEVESRVRRLTLPDTFTIPTTWGARYAKLASSVPACSGFGDASAAQDLMRAFIDPASNGSAAGRMWDHRRLAWV